jgi:hypothetical protein
VTWTPLPSPISFIEYSGSDLISLTSILDTFCHHYQLR